jgi:hypothetical protein
VLEIVADNQSHDDAIDVLLLLTLLFLPLFVSFLAEKREDLLELGFKALNLVQHKRVLEKCCVLSTKSSNHDCRCFLLFVVVGPPDRVLLAMHEQQQQQ